MIRRSSLGPAQRACLFILGEALLLGWLSGISRYAIRRPGFVSNWEIAQLFTPVGIWRNLVWLADSPWRPLYQRASGRTGAADSFPLALLVVSIAMLAWIYLHGERRGQR